MHTFQNMQKTYANTTSNTHTHTQNGHITLYQTTLTNQNAHKIYASIVPQNTKKTHINLTKKKKYDKNLKKSKQFDS